MTDFGLQGPTAPRRPARGRRLLALALVTFFGSLLVLPLLAWGVGQLLPLFGSSVPEFAQQRPRVGDPAPEFALRSLGGAIVQLSELEKRGPVVIEFGSAT